MKSAIIACAAAAIAASVLTTPAATAATGPFKSCAAFNAKYPTGIARSEPEALAAVGRRMEKPVVNKKVYAAARKANKRLGTPNDGVLCEVRKAVSKPGAPTNVTSNPGGARAVYLLWSAPSNDGNAPITGYVVRGPGAISVSGNRATVTGLNPDTEYTFEVFAVNEAGEGEASALTVRTVAEATPTPTPAASSPSTGSTRYSNCSAARAAGVTPIRRDSSPDLYAANKHLDRDGDGIACE